MAGHISQSRLCQVQDQLLGTDLAMTWIFKFLSPQSLLTCRKVSRLFYSYANGVLHRRSDSLKITFKSKKGTSRLSATPLVNGVDRWMSHLTRLMESSPHFPCFHFQFDCCLQSDDLQEFLNCHGHRVTHLQLYLSFGVTEYEPTISALKKLLALQAPFIETLVLDQSYFDLSRNPQISTLQLFPPHCPQYGAVTLVNLKKFVLKDNVVESVVRGIVRAAPHLHHVTYFQNPAPFIELKKLHVLKEFLWELSGDGEDLGELTKFDTSIKDSNMKLDLFGVYQRSCYRIPPECMPKASLILLKILQSTADTLRVFYLMSPLSAFPNLQSFPQLPKVTVLALTWRAEYTLCDENSELFPPDLSLPWTFPNLVKIIFGLHDATKTIEWHQCFTKSNFPGPLLSVKSIEFGSLSCCPPDWLSEFSRVCPNVESIEINNYTTLSPEAAPALWKFEHLKRLKVVMTPEYLTVTDDFAIDAAFTGFSRDTCRELFSEGLRGMSCEDLELRRVRPSILDVKALTHLEVSFVTCIGERASVGRVMTKVTFLYALHKCPNLIEIVVRAGGKNREHAMAAAESLESISPYVPIHVQVIDDEDWIPELRDKALIMI